MGKIQVKRFDEPDEVVSVPGHISQVVTLVDTYVALSIGELDWRENFSMIIHVSLRD